MADRLVIRLATLDDLDAMAEIYNHAVEHSVATFDTRPRSSEEHRGWFESHGDRYPILVAESEGVVGGWASLSPFSTRDGYSITAETSFYVASQRRGQGVGRRLKQALIEEARRQGFHSLIALVTAGNEASLYLNESLGFVRVGTLREVGRKFDRLLDVHILQLLLD